MGASKTVPVKKSALVQAVPKTHTHADQQRIRASKSG